MSGNYKVVELKSSRDGEITNHHVPRLGDKPRFLALDGSSLQRDLMVGSDIISFIGVEGTVGYEIHGNSLVPVHAQPDDKVYVGTIVDIVDSIDPRFEKDIRVFRHDRGDHVKFNAYFHRNKREWAK